MSQHPLPHLRPLKQTGALAFDYALNRRDRLRAEMVQRGKPVIVLSRWKAVGSGYKRTGKVLEFADHHLDGILDLLRELQRALKLQQPNLDPPENAGTANDAGSCNVRTNEGNGDNGECDCEAACLGERKISAVCPPFFLGPIALIGEQQRGRTSSVTWLTADQVNGLALAKSRRGRYDPNTYELYREGLAPGPMKLPGFDRNILDRLELDRAMDAPRVRQAEA
jgi:hypothetical protein